MPKKFSKKQTTLFQRKVYKIVRTISFGKTLTYKEVARLVGRPKAWRAVGNLLNKNTDAKVPCHRVVRSDGSVGGYRYGSVRKACLLKKEGVLTKKERLFFEGGRMAYRQCSQCNAVTDEDEHKCPSCEKNLLDAKIITPEELILKIKKREIVLSRIWTKNQNKFYQTLKSLPL